MCAPLDRYGGVFVRYGVAMAFFRIRTGEPVLASGGGSIDAGFETIAFDCRDQVRDFIFEALVNLAEEAVIGWPVGPERPWEPNHIHSKFRFDVEDNSRGFFISVAIVNPAIYGEFIHEPGNPDRLVWEREVLERLQGSEVAIAEAVEDVIERCFAEG